ncbi:MAG: DNA-3-methyladenine glycosylase I [Rhodobacteraceae bacterium]|nr:DNA-3-methyladenine glycosylase I [Paracoccaceae bacterium]
MENRCSWCGELEIYINYHDQEWGVPEYNSRTLWEKLVLDGFQAGLSWLTILKKRDAFREAFAEFDPVKVAVFGENDVERLLQNTGIVRHRGKIEAAIRGARAWQEIEAREGFDNYLWKYLDGEVLQNRMERMQDVPTSTPLSTQISKDLKKEGFNFVGPTIVYAFMQAVGMVNDHMITCPRHGEVQKLAR